MNYVGVDLHKKSITACVVSQAREVLQSRRLMCVEPHHIEAFFRRVAPSETSVCHWLCQCEVVGRCPSRVHTGAAQ